MITLNVIFLLSIIGLLLYNRASFIFWCLSSTLYLVGLTFLSPLHFLTLTVLWLITAAMLALFGVPQIRQKLITSTAYVFAKAQLPAISPSEREALKAGTVTWDGELFSGAPDWKKLFAYAPARLSEEEQDFLDGPINTLADHQFDVWDMWHKDLTYQPELLKQSKELGLFGLISPRKYGGKEFSVTATWQISMKLGSRLGPISYWMTIANSIGAGELIEHFGSEEQKDHYLPLLASGKEIPCFALTSPIAGSDATAIEDNGVICKGEFEGKDVLGIRLNFNKRYITMACDATVISLAFKLYDPDHLVGTEENIGVTVAIVPTKLKGITQGRRHYPIGAAFPNGPLQGKDVFIPIEYVLGGKEGMGKGWTALTQSLATGRATSLPTAAVGSMKESFYTTTLYTSIRRQFGYPVGAFESVQEKLAELAGYTYISDALRLLTFSQIAAGEKPAIPSAMSKYMTTELARKCAILAMDLQAGKAVMNGPNNMAAANYVTAPVGITVEGSNTMTRGLIVFGQGAVRCHPYILQLMNTLEMEDKNAFDKLIIKQMNFTASNHVRSLFLSLTNGIISAVPEHDKSMKRYLQKLNRLSASFAFLADMSMITLGGKLKRMEALSGRFADVFSMLYMGSAAIKHYRDAGHPKEMQPVVEWSLEWSLQEAEQRLFEIIDNTQNFWLRAWYRFFVFPLGRQYKKPSDALSIKVAKATQSSKDLREDLAEGIYLKHFNFLEEALAFSNTLEPVHKRLHTALKTGTVKGYTYLSQVEDALDKKVITKDEEKQLQEAYVSLMRVLNVDDFSIEELREQK